MNQAGAAEGFQHVPPRCLGNGIFSANGASAGGGPRMLYWRDTRPFFLFSLRRRSHLLWNPLRCIAPAGDIVLVFFNGFSDTDVLPRRDWMPASLKKL